MAKNTDEKIDETETNNPDLEGVPSWLVEAARSRPQHTGAPVSLGLYGKNDGTRRGRGGRKSHNRFDD